MDTPNKPANTYPSVSTSTVPFMPFQIPDHSIRGANFDQLLKERGIRFIHRKSVICPNVKSQTLRGHEPECPFCDNSGYISYQEHEIYGVFAANSLERLFEIQGNWEDASAIISFPTTYVDGTNADFSPTDKIIIPDFEIRLCEMKDYIPTTGNVQKLRYPIISVEYASSVENGILKVYTVGVDFNVVNGKIVWVNGKQPAYDKITGIGHPVTYSYVATPQFNVVRILHEIRATQEMKSGEKQPIRLPQEVMIKRDYIPGKPE